MGDKAAISRLFLELLREQPDFEGWLTLNDHKTPSQPCG